MSCLAVNTCRRYVKPGRTRTIRLFHQCEDLIEQKKCISRYDLLSTVVEFSGRSAVKVRS
ncbi:MAG: hypothetical protein QXM43_04085 [Desulfurococcaceae archaeon]